MKQLSRLFYGVAAFLVITTIVYIIATKTVHDTGSVPGVEWAGTTGLVLSCCLCLMLGGYLHFTERRIDTLPQDWEEAEIEDGAGMLGYFSPTSIWPFFMTVAIVIMGYAICYMAYWLLLLGAVLLILGGVMLNLQYGVPREKH